MNLVFVRRSLSNEVLFPSKRITNAERIESKSRKNSNITVT